MGAEKAMSSIQDVSESETATETIDDHSNPQQGTDVEKTKTTVTGKQDHARQNKNDRNTKYNSGGATLTHSNHVEDKRKLFVGGLPTDSKFSWLLLLLLLLETSDR